MPRDPNINYTEVLIKIGTTTILTGSAHYKTSNTKRITFKMWPPAEPGISKDIQEASTQGTLFVNATGASATNPDFQHKPVKFIKASNDRKEWEFEL